MVRTVISLPEQDKRWLDEEAKRRGISMTALVRVAVDALREHADLERPSLDELLESTRGIWTGPDGLEYQRRMRDEW